MTELQPLDVITGELFALPLDEFTATRNTRVRELREGGDRELAAELQKLRRPPVALWAANQLARQPDVVLAVREATTDAQDAQSRGSASDLRDSLATLQRTLDEVASAAAEVLAAAGHSAADTVTLGTREIVRLAALRGGDDWELLLAGALTYEPEPDLGFGVMPPPRAPSEAKPERKTKPKTPSKPSAEAQAHQRRLREARSKAADDARKAEQAAKLAVRLRNQADDLAERMREAERAALAAEQEAAKAQEQAAKSRTAADTLETDDK